MPTANIRVERVIDSVSLEQALTDVAEQMGYRFSVTELMPGSGIRRVKIRRSILPLMEVQIDNGIISASNAPDYVRDFGVCLFYGFDCAKFSKRSEVENYISAVSQRLQSPLEILYN